MAIEHRYKLLKATTDVTELRSSTGATISPSLLPSSTGGGGNLTPDSHPTTANAADDEFETGTVINAAKWTQSGGYGLTTAVKNGAVLISGTTGSINANAVFRQAIATPSSPWEVICSMPNAANTAFTGIWCGFGGTGQGAYFGANGATFYVITQSTYGGSGASAAASVSITNLKNIAPTGAQQLALNAYLKMSYDGTNLNFLLSFDGRIYSPFYSATPAAVMGGVPTDFGLMCGSSPGAVIPQVAFDFFRRDI